MGRLDDRVCVVSGAASGLGRAIAERLARDGACIGIVDLKSAEETVAAIQALGREAAGWTCDVTDEDQVNRTFEAIGQQFGRIDVLVNNAGILSRRKPWHEYSRSEVERFMTVNFIGYFLVSRAAYPWLKKSEVPGRIINVASRTFFLAAPGQMPYIASKGAVVGMTRALARELGEEGISVNAVMPGQVATPGTVEFTDEATFERTMQNQALKKRNRPEQLADLVAFVASDDAAMITGQTIIVDGGGFMH